MPRCDSSAPRPLDITAERRPSSAAAAPAPLVSIALNVYNAAAHLDECLHGVLLQTHRPLELAVCDNNSNDDSAAILQCWRLRLKARGISMKLVTTDDDDDQGCGLARNRAIAIATGAAPASAPSCTNVAQMDRFRTFAMRSLHLNTESSQLHPLQCFPQVFGLV